MPADDARRAATDRLPWPSTAPQGAVRRSLWLAGRLPRLVLRLPILAYRYTLSSFMGRQCRYLPTCSDYADTAIARHGAWPGLFMATARLCRCHPWGGHGFDPVPEDRPAQARWYLPWRYGVWRFRDPADAAASEAAPAERAKEGSRPPAG